VIKKNLKLDRQSRKIGYEAWSLRGKPKTRKEKEEKKNPGEEEEEKSFSSVLYILCYQFSKIVEKKSSSTSQIFFSALN
jgi:hypothetical protein